MNNILFKLIIRNDVTQRRSCSTVVADDKDLNLHEHKNVKRLMANKELISKY